MQRSKSQMKVRPFWIVFPVIALVCLAFILPGTLKRRAAARTADILTPLIASDLRFSKVFVSRATSGNAIVGGSVDSQADLTDLQQLVEHTDTPQKPLFIVRVLTPETQ
jgi:hypothetical protein